MTSYPSGSKAYPSGSKVAGNDSDLEEQISRPSAPFANEQGVARLPVGRINNATLGIEYTKMTDGPRVENVGIHVGCANTSLTDSEMAAVGYSPDATKSSNPIISGRPGAVDRKTGPDRQPRRGRR